MEGIIHLGKENRLLIEKGGFHEDVGQVGEERTSKEK